MGNSNNLCCTSQEDILASNQHKKNHKLIEHQINNCLVSITNGNIFTEEVDAIVVVTNKKLKASQEITEHINKKGGKSISTEVQKLLLAQGGRFNYGDVAYSHAGEMDFDFIFYAVLPSCSDSHSFIASEKKNDSMEYQPTNSLIEALKSQSNMQQIYSDLQGDQQSRFEKQHIFECILNTLHLADRLGLKSIVYPVMQPQQQYSMSKSIISTITLVAIKTFLQEKNNKLHSLNNIHINVQDTPTMHQYRWSFQQIFVIQNDDDQTHSMHYAKCSLIDQQYSGQEQPIDELIRFGHPRLKTNTNDQSKLDYYNSL